MALSILERFTGLIRAALWAWVLLRCALPLLPKKGKPRREGTYLTLTVLTAIQLLTLVQQLLYARAKHRFGVALGFVFLIALSWAAVLLLQKRSKTRKEPVLTALLLTTAGFSVAASATPGGMWKQCLLFAAALTAYLALSGLLSDPKRIAALRWPMVFGALVLLALNLLLSERIWGARNWLSIAGQSLQPSEFVKVAFIFAGAAVTDPKTPKRGLWRFTGFFLLIALALAVLGDFGTALVFFVCYGMILFLRSGSFLLTALPILGGAGAGAAVLALRPYVARRFQTWGHAWETPLGEGFQQVRAMSAAASGGLWGRGAGNGWLRDVVAADTDLVFGMLCEELGLLAALGCVLAVVLLSVYAVRRTRERGVFFPVAACAAATVFLVQTGLNVLGSMDMLPFTGVTFPFVSRGGSSLITCWGMLAYVTAGGGSAIRKTTPAKPRTKTPAKTTTTKTTTKTANKTTKNTKSSANTAKKTAAGAKAAPKPRSTPKPKTAPRSGAGKKAAP